MGQVGNLPPIVNRRVEDFHNPAARRLPIGGRLPTCPTKEQKAAGITLVEMLVVVAIIALMVGISFPAITSGIDSLRLNAATNGVVSFFNTGLNRAERRQQVVAITISKTENEISMRSTEPGF
ncbi:MAG TPA: prepilin-type N-terminal cleavage/methylation domain-containing protein, partial [Bryobacteraceae bacterium]